jgi:hemolysin activation/secretion protein
VLSKHKGNKIAAHLGLVSNKTASFLADVRMHNQDRKLTSCSGGISYEGVLGSSQCIADLTYHQGLPLLGALEDPPSPATHQPKAQFKKINLALIWIKFNKLLKRMMVAYQFKFSSQHSPDALFNSEQLSLAGLDRVRGFQKHCAGNQGLCMRNELSVYHLFSLSRFTAPLNPFIGLDIGHLFKEKYATMEAPDTSTPWVSWACGCRYSAYGLNVDFTYARPIQPKEKQAYCIYFNFTLGLHHIFSSLASQRSMSNKTEGS